MEHFALFDFDGTIAKGDSIISFMWYSFVKKEMTLKQLLKAGTAYMGYAFGRIDDTQAKEVAISFLQGKQQAYVQAFCQKWYDEKMASKIFVQAAAEIDQLKKEGCLVLVITASPDVYMDPFKKAFGITDVIGTRVDIDNQNIYSGRISGNNCRGIEKNLRLAEYLAAKGWTLDTEKSCGYGNSSHDEAMLHLVGKPVLINPSKKLKKAFSGARIEKWKKIMGPRQKLDK